MTCKHTYRRVSDVLDGFPNEAAGVGRIIDEMRVLVLDSLCEGEPAKEGKGTFHSHLNYYCAGRG